jgi:hypothetical protein
MLVEQHPEWKRLGEASKQRLVEFEEKIRSNWNARRLTEAPGFIVEFRPGKKNVSANSILIDCMPHVKRGVISVLKSARVPMHRSLELIASRISGRGRGPTGPRKIIEFLNEGHRKGVHAILYYMPPEAVPEIFDSRTVVALLDVWDLEQKRLNEMAKNPWHIAGSLEAGRKARKEA